MCRNVCVVKIAVFIPYFLFASKLIPVPLLYFFQFRAILVQGQKIIYQGDTMFKNIALGSALALALVTNAPVFANEHCQKHMDYMTQSLQLTSEQKAKIQTIRDEVKTNISSNRDQLKAIKTQIREMVTSDTIDQAKLDSLIQQKTTLMASMMKSRITMQNQIYNLLTPEQKKQFSDLMSKWEEKRKAMKEGC